MNTKVTEKPSSEGNNKLWSKIGLWKLVYDMVVAEN